MTRLRANNVSSFGTTNPITLSSGSSTTASWTSAPAFATIVAPDYYVIIAEPNTANEEIMYLTAFTSGGTSGTVVRAQEGTSGVAHAATAWWSGATALDFGNGLAIFGDGSDGSPTFDGTTTVLGIAPSPSGSSGVYTLARDLFLASPTLNSGITIITNGFRIFASGTFTNNGTIQWNGNNAVANAAGAALANASGSIYTGSAIGAAGGAGGSGAGTSGSSQSSNSLGGAGGAGGAGSSGGAGGAGAVTAPGGTSGSIRAAPAGVIGSLISGSPGFTGLHGGAGGGGGGGDSANDGGGGGSGGAVVVVCARFITGTGTISANGGNGANGSSSSSAGAGGGGGGGGGVVIVISASVNVTGGSASISGQTVTASGGSLGTGHGTSGANGHVGSAGNVALIPN